MATMFETLSDGLYSALFQAEPEKRRVTIEAWIQSAVPVLSSAIEEELRSYLDSVLETRWSAEGWQSGVRKWRGIMDRYRLIMDIGLRPQERAETFRVRGSVSPETHDQTLRLADQAVAQVESAVAAKLAVEREETARAAGVASSRAEAGSDEGDSSGDRRMGPSPNDQRSNVMNPSNPAYRTASNNRSNQMNPNNPAHRASRGGGRRG